MYDIKDIMKQLQAGATAEEIAAQFSDKLNEAVKAQEEETKRKEAEALRKAAQRLAVQNIINSIADYYNEYGTPELRETFNKWSQEATDRDIDEFIKLLNSMGNLVKLLDMPITFFM